MRRVDLSPIQPGWVPPNVKFEVDDLEDEWLWAPNSFDYIHSRAMVGSIRNWPRFLEQAYKYVGSPQSSRWLFHTLTIQASVLKAHSHIPPFSSPLNPSLYILNGIH